MKYERQMFVLLIIIATLLAISPSLRAAEYNFYFNNAEQGDHSVASPGIQVGGKDGSGPAPAALTPVAPASSPGPAAGLPASAGAVPGTGSRPWLTQDFRSRVRVTGGMTTNRIRSRVARGVFNSDRNSPLPFWEQKDEFTRDGYGYAVSGTYFMTEEVGMTVLLGSLSGIEGEVAPFGSREPFFAPALLAGMILDLKLPPDSSAYVGARAVLNFSPRLRVSLTGRTSLSQDTDFSFRQAEAALVFHL